MPDLKRYFLNLCFIKIGGVIIDLTSANRSFVIRVTLGSEKKEIPGPICKLHRILRNKM